MKPARFLFLSLFLGSCAHNAPSTSVPAPVEEPAMTPDPFAQPSTLPFRLPPFDKVTEEGFRPAFEAAMHEHTAEIAAIAGSAEAPSFDNTIVALERSGARLHRVAKVFFTLESSNTSDLLEEINAEMAPRLAAHQDALWLDDALFARVDAIHRQRDALGLDPESLQLLERYHAQFVHAGARLGAEDKARLKAINERLSSLSTTFHQNVLAATKEGAVVVDDVARLAGLSEPEIAAAAQAAADRGLTGKWVLTLSNTTRQPVLALLVDRELRKQVFEASSGRCTGGPNDNTGIVVETVKLRAEKARLLGFASYAAYKLSEESAKTPEAAMGILQEIAPAALAQARFEARAVQAAMDADRKAAKLSKASIEPWDWAFYAEKVRQQQFAFDAAEVKPYFDSERVLQDGVFWSATQLYGVTFEEVPGLPLYRPDVRAWEVKNADGSTVGLFVLDPYSRDNKSGGAWMDTLVDQSGLLGELPVVTNNWNVDPPAPGQPVLLTWDEVDTAFHEFGHAVHGLFSNVRYPMLSGTNTPSDFVEYPSQINEMWAREPAVLAHYARHHQTGEPLPQALLDKVIASSRFNGGFDATEAVEAAIIDLSWHQLGPDEVPDAAGVAAFEAKALEAAGIGWDVVPPRYHSPYFSHIFDGGYAAGYYAYVWSEVLARDSGAWFLEHGGMTRENGDAFRAGILSRGRSAEPDALFQAFNGGPPEIGPLLEYRGIRPPN